MAYSRTTWVDNSAPYISAAALNKIEQGIVDLNALGGSTDPEVVRDTIAAALVAGANVTITPNDVANTITVAATGSGGGASATLVVAANDASAHSKSGADYQCDGTGDQTEINNAIAALPSTGGRVQLTEGTFNIASSILIQNDNVTLIGAGAGQRTGGTQTGVGTKLKAASGLTSAAVLVQRAANDRPVYGVLLRDFTVDGNSIGTAVDGIVFRANRAHIDHVHVHKCTGSGIRVQGYVTWDTYDTIIAFAQVGDCTDTGIYLDTNGTDDHLTSCILYNNNYNIRLKGSSAQITACHTYDATTNNIFFDGGGSRTKIVNCKIEGAGQHGINIDSTNGGYADIQITGCNLANNGDATDNTADHIILQGPSGNGIGRTNIIGNSFSWKGSGPKPRYGVNLNASSAQNTLVTGNTFGPATHFGTSATRNNGSTTLPSIIKNNLYAPLTSYSSAGRPAASLFPIGEMIWNTTTVQPNWSDGTNWVEPGAGGSTDPEVVRDTMAAALVGGTGIAITPNDVGDTITIASTGGGGSGGDAFVTVAANDSPAAQKANADYICDGTNDHVEIQAALDLLQTGTGGEVYLLPGTYNTAATVTVGINGNSTQPVMLRFAAGALVRWTSVTGRTPIISVQGWLCDLFNPSVQGSGTKGNGIGVQLGGTGNTVHGCTVWSPKISSCDTAIEFGIVSTSSSGECSVIAGRLSNVKTGVQSNAFVNYVDSCFISGVDVGVRQSADRSSGKVVVSNTTINEWASAAIELLRGRGSVFQNIWMEHTSVQSAVATEIIRIAPTGTDTVVNPTFSGVTHLHAIASGTGTQEVYGLRLSGNVEGLYAEHLEFTDESVSSALIRQDATHVGLRNIIKEVSYGDPVPSSWSHAQLLSKASTTGVVVVQESPAPAGSPAGLTVGATTPIPSRATYYIDKSGTANNGVYWAKRYDGHVAQMQSDATSISGLKAVLEGLAGDGVSFQFGPGRYHFKDAPLGSEGWAGSEDHASYVGFDGLAFYGAGMNTTTISNRSNWTGSQDTEPFSFSNCQDVTIRDMTVESCGFYRTTTDAIDFDQGARCLVERVRVRRSRSRAFVFDGGDAGKNSGDNTVRDCVIQGRPEKPQLSTVSGGTLTASTSYRYMVSWTDPDLAAAGSAGETKPSEVTEVTTDATNRSVRIYLTPGPYGCTERRIYRAPTGSASWVRVTTVADNTTTQFIDTGGAGTAVTMPVSHRSTIPQAGIEALGSSGNKFIDNVIDGVGDDPVGTSGFGVNLLRKGSGTTLEHSDRNLVRGNTIRQSISNGVRVAGGSDNLILDNYVINPGSVASRAQALRVTGAAGQTNNNNVFSGNRTIDDQDANSWTTDKTTSNGLTIAAGGTLSGTIVKDNLMDAGATSPLIADGGTSSIIEGNPGYNPQGPASITVTASPFTYTAGSSPEMVYITGGTVSLIVKSGTTLFTSTEKSVRLEANQAVVVTYSSAPTMNKDRL